MKMKDYILKRLAVSCLLSAVILAIACELADDSDSTVLGDPSDLAFEVVIVDALGNSTTSIPEGEIVTFVLRVSNPTTLSVPVTYASAQTHDFIVRDGETEIWKWSYDLVVADVVVEETILPGEILEFDENWSQADNEGLSVPPGSYTLTSIYMGGADADVSIEFSISNTP